MAQLPEHAIVMHPGPMNRGMEIAAEVADSPRSTIVEQVANGVSVRMAVLYLLLGGAEARPVSADGEHLADPGQRGRCGGERRRDLRLSATGWSSRRSGPARPRRPGRGAQVLDADGPDRPARPGRPAHPPARAGPGGRRDRRDRHRGRRARRVHRRARDGQHRPGGRHRRRGRAGLAARAARPATATCSRSARSPSGWPASSSPSSARWPTRRPGCGCSPTTAAACPTRC